MKLTANTLMLMLVGLFIQEMDAQKLADKLNEKIASKSTSSKFESQSITASSWQDGDYDWYTKRSGTWYFDKEEEQKNLTFTKNDKGEVTEIKMGKYTYRGDAYGKSEFVRYFAADGSSWHLYFSSKSIIIFSGDSGDMTSIKGCLKAKAKEGDVDKMKAFLAEGKNAQSADIEKYNARMAEQKKQEEAERELKFSIKGKEVVKLEIINLVVPEKFGHFTSFTFDIKATLKDGKEISTDNGGFRSDYNINYNGCDYSEGKIGHQLIKDDKIILEVSSKYNPAIKTSVDVIPLYNMDIVFNYNARSWSRDKGESANSYRVEVKQMKHKVKGNDVLAIRIYNVTMSKIESEFKMSADKTFKIYCKGGNGGTDNGRGNDGGNGGDLTIIKDPNVKTFNIDQSTYGGKGGKGNNSSYDGRNGRDGTYKEEVRAVTF